jgi:hypothetical protein
LARAEPGRRTTGTGTIWPIQRSALRVDLDGEDQRVLERPGQNQGRQLFRPSLLSWLNFRMLSASATLQIRYQGTSRFQWGQGESGSLILQGHFDTAVSENRARIDPPRLGARAQGALDRARRRAHPGLFQRRVAGAPVLRARGCRAGHVSMSHLPALLHRPADRRHPKYPPVSPIHPRNLQTAVAPRTLLRKRITHRASDLRDQQVRGPRPGGLPQPRGTAAQKVQ